MAERLGNQASNQKVVGSIPGLAKLCVLGQGTSPFLPGGGVSLWIRASAKLLNVNVTTSKLV